MKKKNFRLTSIIIASIGLIIGLILVVSIDFLRNNWLSYFYIPIGISIILFCFYATMFLIFGKK